MEYVSLTGRIFRGAALTLVLLFFMFPIVWILLMSFQSNEQILRIPPRLLFEHGGVMKFALAGEVDQFVVRDAAP